MPREPTLPLLLSSFIFLRHGETEPNRLGLIAGSSDVELNETGWRQARHAAELLVSSGVDSVYSSAMRRARDTAECVAAALGLSVTVIPELGERNWGELEGKSRELRGRNRIPPGGESSGEFSARTLAGLRKIPASRLPLLVAHSGTFRVMVHLLGIDVPPDPVNNSQPMRFVPPQGVGSHWSVEIMR